VSASAFDLIVFDLDGTLIDSRRDLADAVNALLVEEGAPPLPEWKVGGMVGDGAAMLVARAFAAARRRAPADALARFLAIYADHLTDHTRPYEGMPAVLAELAARGPLAILTNKPLASTHRVLDRLDLAKYFSSDLVVGGDGPFPRKPDPASLRDLVQRCAVDPDRTLMVGDSLIDWRTAHAAAITICLARYGFGFDTFPRACVRPDDLAIDAPADLLSL
jgi:phosphoglycolate phosphatase